MDVASRQAGAISAGQLLSVGLTRGQVRGHVRAGLLRRAGQGLYVLAGQQQDWRCRLWLALLGAGPSGFACRRSAAALWGFDGVPEEFVEVAVPRGHHPRGSKIVRLTRIQPGEVTTIESIPVTSPGRTLIDLGAVVAAPLVERCLESALRQELVAIGDLDVVPSSRTPGSSVLRAILAQRPEDAPPTESDAETLFLLIARSMGLPEPMRQVAVERQGKPYRLDFAWPQILLAIEIDGASVHGPDHLGADLRRQNHILLRGWTILRFTWAMVAFDEHLVRRDLAAAWRACAVSRSLARY